jgi:hypothetical protein
MNRVVFAIIFRFTGLCTVHGQGEWNLRKESDGIYAYTRSLEGSRFDEYRVETTMKGNLESFYALIKDFDSYPEFFADTENIQILKNLPDEHVMYIHTNAPFPAKDRDGVFRNVFRYLPDRDLLRIDISCVNDGYVASKRLIQIKSCGGFWEVTEKNQDEIFVRHQFVADPGGRVPAFIINLKTVQNPINTLKSIRDYIGSPKYQIDRLPTFKK